MSILATVTTRLSALGYKAVETDTAAIQYNIDRAEAEIKAATNQADVPLGLFHTWVNMAAGLFLFDKKASGALSDVYDFSAPATSVSEGDTSVSFAATKTGTFEDQFDTMLAKMIHPADDLLVAYRRLSW